MAEPGGEHLLTCFSCGTCAATCLVRRYEPAFNPRLLLRRAGMGLREQVLSSAGDLAVLGLRCLLSALPAADSHLGRDEGYSHRGHP